MLSIIAHDNSLNPKRIFILVKTNEVLLRLVFNDYEFVIAFMISMLMQILYDFENTLGIKWPIEVEMLERESFAWGFAQLMQILCNVLICLNRH